MARLRLFVGNMDICADGLTYPVGMFDPGTAAVVHVPHPRGRAVLAASGARPASG